MDQTTASRRVPEDLEGVTSALQQEIDWAETFVMDLQARQFDGKRENALVYCLLHTLELGKASLLCINSSLPDALTLMSRALLESLFWARYVSLSDENAEVFERSALENLKRIARKNLRAGYARVVDNNTGDDRTDEFLESDRMRAIQGRLRIEEVAEAAGFGSLYSVMYGFDSIYAHGTAYGIDGDPDIPARLYTSTCASLGYFQCVSLISADWLKCQKMTPASTLSQMLGIRLDAP